MSKKSTIAIIAAGVIGAVAAWTARGVYDIYVHSGLYSKLSSIQGVLDSKFLYTYDEEKAADMAALGITASLEDPYTIYYDKKQFSDYKNLSKGDFIGIGVTVVWDKEKDEILVTSVMENSPGEKAGIVEGDVIVAVEGTTYAGSQMTEAVNKIKGVENTPVEITIKRGTKNLDLTLIRERIHEDTVSCSMKDGEIGYIRISAFNNTMSQKDPSTDKEFEAAIEELTKEGMKKLIIDLRDNGGGDLQVVSHIIDSIVPEGIIMYYEDKFGNRTEMKSDKEEMTLPMVVLVNGNSASASELMTGALRDYKKATVIGEKTYGKGVMQHVMGFSDGSGMTVTVAKYYTPLGTCVEGTGITPDITIANSGEEDIQLKSAVDYLKERK